MQATKPDLPTRRAIMVLGMHRSGTSAVSGILNLLGYDGPRTPMPPDQANAKGYFESAEIHKFHTGLLRAAGSSWTDLQRVPHAWFASPEAADFRQQGMALVEQEFGLSRPFVLKDPRICRLVPFWRDTLGAMNIQPLILHIHRNPLDVVASLTKLHDISHEIGLLLWLRHMLDAERDTRTLPRHFTSYDLVLGNWSAAIDGLETSLGLSLPQRSDLLQSQVNEFLTPSLRNFASSPDTLVDNSDIPDRLRSVFDIRQRWARDGENADDYALLDSIAVDFDQAAQFLGPIVLQRKHTLRALKTAHEAQSAQLAERDASLREARRQASASNKLRDMAQAQVVALRKEHREAVGTITAKLARSKVAVSRAEEANAALKDSTSWRITAPLRKVVLWLKRIRGR